LIFATIACVCGIVFLLVLNEAHWNSLPDAVDMTLFQRATGGLGMGAAATPSWNILYYDPRLQAVDDSNLWPVPGSYPYTPTAAFSVVAIKELPRDDLRIIKVEQ
jgi:hypothetical protein